MMTTLSTSPSIRREVRDKASPLFKEGVSLHSGKALLMLKERPFQIEKSISSVFNVCYDIICSYVTSS